jgi:16S rRNA (cytosine1402-N4)-methyltransferase
LVDSAEEPPRPPRRVRYAGKNPRRWSEKYKEHRGDPVTLEKVAASGKTAAGTHRPILVEEILHCLQLQAGQRGVDATLGYGGHAQAILARITPGGCLLGLDQDTAQLPRTARRLQDAGWQEPAFCAIRRNFAGITRVLEEKGWEGADFLLADLGVSSMQIDNPARGFSYKQDGPLDMRMNPERGEPASRFLEKIRPAALAKILHENADEPESELLAASLAENQFSSTLALVKAVERVLGEKKALEALPRVFQAIRIAVNEEFAALEGLLRSLPTALAPGGRVAILTFHSGEDRRVKKAFKQGFLEGIFSKISPEVIRAGPEECRANTRASSAKLRWAERARTRA